MAQMTLAARARKEREYRVLMEMRKRKIAKAITGHLFNLPDQYRAHLDDDSIKYLCIKGGRGAVKSYSFVAKLVEESFQKKFENCGFLFAREVMTSIEDSVFGLVKLQIRNAQLDDFFTIYKNKIVNNLTGVQFIFLGLRATGGKTAMSQLNKIKGKVALKWIFVDEAQDLTEEVINVLFPTVNRGTNSGVIPQFWHEDKNLDTTETRFLFAMNVNKPVDPIVGKLKTMGKEATILHVNIFDLPPEFQDPQLIKQAKAEEKEIYYPHVWLGEPFYNFGGFAFSKFNFIESRRTPAAFCCFLDPSFKGKDYTAITFLGEVENKLVAWGYCWRRSWDNCLDDIAEAFIKYQPDVFWYEDNSLGTVPGTMLANIGIVAGGKTSIYNKESRIYKAAIFTAGMVSILESHSNAAYCQNLRDYNGEADTENDDGADSYASVVIHSGIVKDKIKW